jgi:predicted Zn-dependent protease
MVQRLLPMLTLLPALSLGGCAMLPGTTGNLYETRREAQAAYEGNENERAEKLLLGLTRAVPNDADTWFYLGNLYARTNRPEQAVQAYQKTLMLNSGDARAWHNLGVVRLRQGWAAFIQAYDLTVPGNPLHARADAIIGAMEKIPLEGMKRKPAAPAPADGGLDK